LLNSAHIVLTDSGGVQEEAPSLGKPVLVMRDTTERPEAVEAGTVKLVGTDAKTVWSSVMTLLRDPHAYRAMATAVNPYGDGHAAARTIAAIGHFFKAEPRPAEFDNAEDDRATA
jgi:UDP-N-acetylglucosamine 2-epimerase (non-hydrolysing)